MASSVVPAQLDTKAAGISVAQVLPRRTLKILFALQTREAFSSRRGLPTSALPSGLWNRVVFLGSTVPPHPRKSVLETQPPRGFPSAKLCRCKTDMAILERTPSPGPSQCPPQCPLGSECWSVGANSHQCRQDGAVLARSSAGRRQGLAEQLNSGTGTPLPILAVTGWAASLVHGEGPPVPGRMGQASCCCGSREALSEAEAVLSADVRLTRGRKRSERRLLLLQEDLVIAKLQGGTTVRPQLRLALDQLWVLSGAKEVAGEEGEEEEGSSAEDSTSLVFIWPTGSCIANFGSRALKELWVGTLLGTPEGATRARVTRLPSIKLVEKELSRRHAWKTLSTRSLERLMEGQAKADDKQGPPPVPSSSGEGLCHAPAGGSRRKRRRGLPWPFALWQSPAAAQAPGQAGSSRSRPLFGQPLAAVCGEDGTLPQPIMELLAVLQQEGPSTEGIFRRAASGTALRELREALDHGADVDLGSQPAVLLAVILKDFLRSIPSKLLVNDLYEDWMAAMQKSGKEEKVEELKAVAEKLPAANRLLLKRLLSVLQHIGHNAATSRMSCSNLAICVGPNLLSPAKEELLPLEAMLEVAEKVKVLVEFLLENCTELFGEETTELSRPAAEEWPAPTERSQDLCLEEQSVPADRAGTQHQAEASSCAPLSLLGVLQEAGGDTVVASEMGEAPAALPPASPESAADSPGCPEELASLSEERRFAGSPWDKEMRRIRKRQQAWGEESESHVEKKKRKKEKVLGDGARKRWRKAQKKRRCRFVFTG